MIVHCMFIPHFAYPFIYDGHIGHFYVLAIVNNAAINTVYKYLFEALLSILLDIYSKVGLLSHMVVLFFIF